MTDKPSFTLFELNSYVKASIDKCFPSTYWVRAELSEVRANANGHCYIEFIEKGANSTIVAKARGTIWRDKYATLHTEFEQRTGNTLAPGIKVMVEVKPTFHPLFGYSLNVLNIDPNYTIGDMVLRRKEILEKLKADGVLTLNKELPLPLIPKHIAVISSASAAGYGDFCNQLQNNRFGFTYHVRLFPAVMQGEYVASSIRAALAKIYSHIDFWDLVVIIRGGGAVSDLSDFDSYELAFHCAQFPIPILTGIGHERDDTVIDMISYQRVKTPTAAAEYILSISHQVAEKLNTLSAGLQNIVGNRLQHERQRLESRAQWLPTLARMHIEKEKTRQKNLKNNIRQLLSNTVRSHHTALESFCKQFAYSLQLFINTKKQQLALSQTKFEALSPDSVLKRGYTLTTCNGKITRSARDLHTNDILVTLFADGKIESLITTQTMNDGKESTHL